MGGVGELSLCVSACLRVCVCLRCGPPHMQHDRSQDRVPDRSHRAPLARSVKAGHGSGRDRFTGGGNRPPSDAVGHRPWAPRTAP